MAAPMKTMKTRSPGYETRGCGECGGSGSTMHCGNGPHDRTEIATCTRCGGEGQARVFVYAVQEVRSATRGGSHTTPDKSPGP